MTRTGAHRLTCAGAALLLSLAASRCSGPTGDDDKPVLSVSTTELDFGTERTSLSMTIANTGSGTLNFQIQAPSEGWIDLSHYNGIVVNEPVTVEVRIDREKAPVGDQEVKLVVTALEARAEVTVRASIRRPGVLSVTPAVLVFDRNTTQRQLTVGNEGGEALAWQAVPAQGWIAAAPDNGRLEPGDEQVVTVTIDHTDQPAGEIQGSVDLTAAEGSKTVAVRATVPENPELAVVPAELDFGSERTSLTFTIANEGTGSLTFQIQVPSEGWITLSQYDGIVVDTPVSVDVRIDREQAPVGDQEVELVVTGADESREVTVRASVRRPGVLEVAPLRLGFDEATTQRQITLRNAGGEVLAWEATPAQGWIEVVPAGGSLEPGDEQVVTVTIDHTDQPAGEIQGSVDITTEEGSKTVAVQATVPENPELSVVPVNLDFGSERTSLAFTIANEGTGSLTFQIQVPSEGWITLSQYDGIVVDTPVSVDVRIDREQAPTGDQEVELVITGANKSERVTVRAMIRRPGKLLVTPATLDFGETSKQRQITLRNEGGEALAWQATSAQEWVALEPAGGDLKPGDRAVVTVTIDRENQQAGSSIRGSVDLTSDGGSATVSVGATVPARPSPSVSPKTLNFGLAEERLFVELSNIGTAVLEWSLEETDAWIRPTARSGSVPVGDTRRVYIEVEREGLEPGTYRGTLTFRWAGENISVDVFLRVSAEPLLELSEESLQAGTESSISFSIINSGSGDLIWEIAENEDWLELEPAQGTSAAVAQTITGTITREGLEAGEHSANIRIESNAGSRTLPLTMKVPEPVVVITEGPPEGFVIDEDEVLFQFESRDTWGTTEFSHKMDGGEWSPWGEETTVRYQHLEESSLVGPHVFEVRVRADAGTSEPQQRVFEVDAVQGPALLLSPKVPGAARGEEMTVDVVAEEIEGLLAMRLVLDFDAGRLRFAEVSKVEGFLDQNGGEIVGPLKESGAEEGRLDLSLGVAGGSQAGVSGTGRLVSLRFEAVRSGDVSFTWHPDTSLRNADNQPLAVDKIGSAGTVR